MLYRFLVFGPTVRPRPGGMLERLIAAAGHGIGRLAKPQWQTNQVTSYPGSPHLPAPQSAPEGGKIGPGFIRSYDEAERRKLLARISAELERIDRWHVQTAGPMVIRRGSLLDAADALSRPFQTSHKVIQQPTNSTDHLHALRPGRGGEAAGFERCGDRLGFGAGPPKGVPSLGEH